MFLIDKKTNLFTLIVIVFSTIGINDIVSEILEEQDDIFSENFMKWFLVFTVFYAKSRSYYAAAILSIALVLLFPKVFLGEKTSIRKIKKQAQAQS
jgi:predicted membrane protein